MLKGADFASSRVANRARTATAAASAMAVLPAPVGAHTSTDMPARKCCTASFWKSSRGNWNVSSMSSKVRLLLADMMSASICDEKSYGVIRAGMCDANSYDISSGLLSFMRSCHQHYTLAKQGCTVAICWLPGQVAAWNNNWQKWLCDSAGLGPCQRSFMCTPA